MSAKTGISWTDASWNPIRGCSRVSKGCEHCYAETVAARFSGPGQPYEGLARVRSSGEPQWTGLIQFVEKHIADPLRWKEPKKIFVNSMSDLFHEKVKDEWLRIIFGVMAAAPQHTFQILTKRPRRMREWVNGMGMRYGKDADAYCHGAANDFFAGVPVAEGRARGMAAWDRAPHVSRPWPLPNVGLGTSVEDQPAADERIPHLLRTQAAFRFLSCEPLIAPVIFTRHHQYCPEHDFPGGFCTEWHEGVRFVDWIIAGGESGKGRRPMELAWLESLHAQSREMGSAFFAKQDAAMKPGQQGRIPNELWVHEFPSPVAT